MTGQPKKEEHAKLLEAPCAQEYAASLKCKHVRIVAVIAAALSLCRHGDIP